MQSRLRDGGDVTARPGFRNLAATLKCRLSSRGLAGRGLASVRRWRQDWPLRGLRQASRLPPQQAAAANILQA
jgi:hypothetical protein